MERTDYLLLLLLKQNINLGNPFIICLDENWAFCIIQNGKEVLILGNFKGIKELRGTVVCLIVRPAMGPLYFFS